MKNIICIIYFLSFVKSFAQPNFQGKAIYEWRTSSEDFRKTVLNDPKMDPKRKTFIESKMEKMFNKTFILNFDKTTSIYKEEEKLDIKNNGGNNSWSSVGLDIVYYKNLKTRKYIIVKDLMSKYFSVEDSLPTYDWKFETETKQIGSYLCNKATVKIPLSAIEKADYEEEKAADENKNTHFLEIKKPKERQIIAWYTNEIPISQGPESYSGLPGLILELNDGKSTILCSKIIINTKEKIKLPSNSKTISKKDYDKLVKKKNAELNEVDFIK